MKNFTQWNTFNADKIRFALGQERNGKATVNMYLEDNAKEVALVTPACVTHWPRVTGDGNFGTMWGPAEVGKAKFTLDLSDAPVCDAPNANFEAFAAILTAIDERLLSFVYDNQLKVHIGPSLVKVTFLVATLIRFVTLTKPTKLKHLPKKQTPCTCLKWQPQSPA